VVDSVDAGRLAAARAGHEPLAGGRRTTDRAAVAPGPATPGAAEPGAGDALRPGAVVVRVDPRYYRPTEVSTLLGDASKARKRLGWVPTIGFGELVSEMVTEDLAEARRDALNLRSGFAVKSHRE
jgi:GDPmannose 4,6-dehydratase